MEITREIELDAPADDVWRLLADPDELAGWVGDEVRERRVLRRRRRPPPHLDLGARRRRVARSRSTVVEDRRAHAPSGSSSADRSAAARACSIGDAWDDRLFGLELRASPTHRLVAADRADVADAGEVVFDALADPTRRAVLRAVAEDGPLTATELGAAPARDAPGRRQAPRRARATPVSCGGSATGRDVRFSFDAATARRGPRLDRRCRRPLGPAPRHP